AAPVCGCAREVRRRCELQMRYGARCGEQQLTHAVQRQVNVVQVIGVAEPDEAFAVAAKGRARQAGYTGFLEESVSEIAAGKARGGDIRERIKGAIWLQAAHARQRVQTRDNSCP